MSRSQKLYSSCNAKHSPTGSIMLSIGSLDTLPQNDALIITHSKWIPSPSDTFVVVAVNWMNIRATM